MTNLEYTILKTSSGQTSYDIPIFLNSTLEDLGVMSVFDGDLLQIEQKSNFTYSGDTLTLIIYNTVNTNVLTTLINSIFTIYWGDGNQNTLAMTQISDTNLPYVSHTYSTGGAYEIKVTIESPWNVKEIYKTIELPFVSSYGFPTDLGELTFTMPYSTGVTQTQEYLIDYQITTGNTEPAVFECVGVDLSRIDELKKYGNNNVYTGITTGITADGYEYSGYTIDDLYYMDFADGLTYVSGTTVSGYTDELYKGKLTRDEFFIGFIDEPEIYSDVNIDRGKMGVSEKNLRLAEIDNLGELENYGNSYFNVIKS